ncbi:MAG: tetratricopeptide repeat protein [Chloroflexota bacterium]
MDRLPVGTVTFAFTDIEGSTRLLTRLGAAFPPIIRRHHAILREVFASHAGVEVRTEGDSFFVVFPAATDAVAAAVAAQRAMGSEPWPDGVTVQVRMGMHTGLGELLDDDYVGLDVHRAARIAAAGHGGQILVSETTRSLAASATGVAYKDLGQHRLKDLPAAEHIYQIVVDGLRSDFPAPRSVEARPTNLPVNPVPILGRERELERVTRFLRESRLVTLTGPGGTGKTSLALAVAARVRDDFDDGVFVAWLAGVRDPDLVASAIAAPIGVQESGNTSASDVLIEHLKTRQMLLVLDNFEQLLGAAPYLAQLLDAAPGLQFLVTSQARLHLQAEQAYEIWPLPVPNPAASLDTVRANPGVQLFEARAQAVRPDFSVTADNAAAVAAIVDRLDGLPLAIELAATRLRMLSPSAVLKRLDSRLAILTGGALDRPQRHQTLRATLEWSHDLLPPEARELIARLSVFHGGFDFDAADRIAGLEPPIAGDAMDLLGTLVDQSLVRTSDTDGEPRFSMLETIREFARERLAETGNGARIAEEHARWFRDLAETLRPTLTRLEGPANLDRLEREHPNVRAALAWSIEHDDAATAQRLVGALWRFWHLRGHIVEGHEAATAALAMGGATDDAVRSRALVALGGLAYWRGQFDATTALYEQAVTLARRAASDAAFADAACNHGMMLAFNGRTTEAFELLEESEAAFLAAGDQAGLAPVLFGRGYTLAVSGRLPEARETSLRAAEVASRFGEVFWEGTCLHAVGQCERLMGNALTAEPFYRRALDRLTRLRDRSGISVELDMLAFVAAMLRDHPRALRLAAAAATLRESIGSEPLHSVLLYSDPVELVAEFVDPGTIAEETAEGRSWSTEAAIAYAMGPGADTAAVGGSGTGPVTEPPIAVAG